MEVSYWLYGEELGKHEGAIGTDEVIETEIMDQGQKVWKQAKVKLYHEAVADTEPVGLLGPFSEPYDEGRFHVRVIEILPSPLEDD